MILNALINAHILVSIIAIILTVVVTARRKTSEYYGIYDTVDSCIAIAACYVPILNGIIVGLLIHTLTTKEIKWKT